VRLHKLIYKFTEDLSDLVHDLKLAEAKAKGEATLKEIIGSAAVLQTFSVTSTRGKKEATVQGSKIVSGYLDTKSKYQVIRDDEILCEGLSLSSLRHLKTTVQRLESGSECGLVFDWKKEIELKRGDII
jgi:translation initiation factor IF-2